METDQAHAPEISLDNNKKLLRDFSAVCILTK